MRRIRIDLTFEIQSEGDEVWTVMKKYLKEKKIKSHVNETSFIDYEECNHSIGLPCIKLERFVK